MTLGLWRDTPGPMPVDSKDDMLGVRMKIKQGDMREINDIF